MNYSRQREAITNLLKESVSHPTAEDIYNELKSDYPKLSLATVYRNLGELTDGGQALAIKTGGKVHYDGNLYPHAHVACPVCGRVTDLPLSENDLENIQKLSPGEFRLTFFSACERCKNKNTIKGDC